MTVQKVGVTMSGKGVRVSRGVSVSDGVCVSPIVGEAVAVLVLVADGAGIVMVEVGLAV